MPCPHGQGGDGWGPRQRGNGPLYLARSVVYPQASPPHFPGGAEVGIEERVSAARAAHVAVRRQVRRAHSASGGSRAVTVVCAGTALDGTWRLRDGPRPVSQRKRRLKGRASGGVLARRLKAGRSHFRVFVCGQPDRRRPAAAASSRATQGALERSGRPLGRARRAETRAFRGSVHERQGFRPQMLILALRFQGTSTVSA